MWLDERFTDTRMTRRDSLSLKNVPRPKPDSLVAETFSCSTLAKFDELP